VSHCTTISGRDASWFIQAQAGDTESLEQLMRAHEGLVHHIVRQQWRGSLGYEEAVHAGRMGLWRAIVGFDPERGSAFSSYAGVVIARHVWRAVELAEGETQTARAPASTPLCRDPQVEVLAWEVRTALRAMVERLPPKQRQVVCIYYGLDGWGGCTLAQLAHRLGCSRQAVHYHLRKALLRLRHPAFSMLLRAMLGRNRRLDYLRALHAQRRGK
jgi:RNA polymerase sigma factor (sigma-70 family)